MFLLFSSSTVSQSAIIQDNGYSDVVIAINDRVIDPSNPLQNYNFIEELKVSNCAVKIEPFTIASQKRPPCLQRG